MNDQQTLQLFAATRDSLKGREATLAALMDLADGHPFPVPDQWVYAALVKRGLMVDWMMDYETGKRLMMETGTPYALTDYGRAFVAWYRSPRELPVQMNLFEED